ncbi:zinc finger protein ZFAT-like [Littorina saxatilis]|uniref:zinc finger protein ZFAT-like n=1 Tax=Littorina saxatilis TaxID=31220 RepID=UPI0038B476E2
MDTFICGTCQDAFNDMEVFMQHKQKGCSHSQPDVIQVHVDHSGEVTELTGADGIMEEGSGASPTTLTFLNEMADEGRLATLHNQEGDGGTRTYIILNDTTNIASDTLQLEPVAVTTSGKEGSAVIEVTGAGEETPQTNTEHVPKKTPGRRGRKPKKAGEIKTEPMEAVPSTPVKPNVPEKDKDGKLRCPNCHRTFNKERHFKTHKCLASSLYIDISKREVRLDSGDEGELEEMEAGAIDDDQEEYRAPPEADQSEDSELVAEEAQGNDTASANAKDGSFKNIQLHTDADTEGGPRDRNTLGIEDVPIFRSEEEKIEFETTLNIDLSCIDHMFKVHVIDQDINENAGSYGRGQLSALSLYSCTVCEKVFKTLSHMRLHCLVHTDLKPFKCTKCSYATNTKGNLYTHMRKHTGQYYQCKHCDFHSVNKSHLVEHEATHEKKRHPCAICQKDYATGKSLINHVRKYHSNTRKGQKYLQTFLQGRQVSGSTVIHQCHVCNRKFKKKIDRDRHLFVHDIRDVNMTHQCELCEYQASRRVYLEKHYLKHRVLYCCILCGAKFLSTVKLLEHLSGSHGDQQSVAGRGNLFERCINSSLYLPEPDEQLPAADKPFVNLPPELSASAVNNTAPDADVDTITQTHTDADTITQTQTDTDTVTQTRTETIAETTMETSMETDTETTKETSTEIGTVTSTVDGVGETAAAPEAGAVAGEGNWGVDEGGEAVHTASGVSQVEGEGPSLATVKKEVITVMVDEDGVTDILPTSDITRLVTEASKTDPSPALTDQGESSATQPNTQGAGGEALSQTASQSLDPVPDSDVPLVPNPGGEVQGEEGEEMGEGLTGEAETEEEAGLEGEVEGEGVSGQGEEKDEKKNIVERLGFRKMNMQIFQKMRETFGSEECEFCGRLFYTKQDYEPHLRTHTGDRPFRCNDCPFRAIARENLRRHVEREHQNVKFACKECEFVATSRTRLWNHQLSHLGISGLECPHCTEKFESIKRLRVHMTVSHPDLPREELDKLTAHKHKMQGKMGRRSYKCPYCERVFIRANSELQKHIWIHEGVKPYKCSLCTYACRSKNNLQAHMLRHSSHKPFACQECGKAYKSKTALRWHVRSHKTGNLFKCDKCSYEAQQRSHLKRHMETHEVQKRFTCHHCDYSANTAGYMKIHYARAHKGLQYSPELHGLANTTTSVASEHQVFKCLSCDYLFGNLSDLKRHLKIRHHVQVQDIAGIEQMQISEVEVVQCAEEQAVTETTEIMEQESVLTSGVRETVNSADLDEKTASAVTLLQQIINMQSQGAFGQQEIKVMSEDGQLVTVNPETIIVQQHDGQQVLVTNADGHADHGQYVIQYIAPDDDPNAVPSMEGVPMEIHTVDTELVTE